MSYCALGFVFVQNSTVHKMEAGSRVEPLLLAGLGSGQTPKQGVPNQAAQQEVRNEGSERSFICRSSWLPIARITAKDHQEGKVSEVQEPG